MARFSEALLKEITDKIPLSEIVGRHVNWDKKKTRPSSGDYWAPCPFHGEKSASFHVLDKRGMYHCFGCSVNGGHYKFLMEYSGLSFPEAVEKCADIAGVTLPNHRTMTPAEKADAERRAEEQARMRALQDARQREADEKARQKRIKTVRDIWQETKPFKNSLAQTYLEWRCPDLSRYVDESVIRFHEALEHPDMPGKEHPALVAKLQDSEGRGVAIWRIFLAKDGCGKLKVPPGSNAKMALGPSSGAACRIGGIAKKIGGAEGIETSLAARALGVAHPVWPMLSTGGLIGFQFPTGVDEFIYFPDPDGQKVRFKKRVDGTEFISGPPGMEAVAKFLEKNKERNIRVSDAAHDADMLEILQKMKGVPIR